MPTALYLAPYVGSGFVGGVSGKYVDDAYRPKYADAAEGYAGIGCPSGLVLTTANSSDPVYLSQLQGDLASDPTCAPIIVFNRASQLDQPALPILPRVTALLLRAGLPAEFLIRNSNFLTIRQMCWYIGASIQLPQRINGHTRGQVQLSDALDMWGSGATRDQRVADSLDRSWNSLSTSQKEVLGDSWLSMRNLSKGDPNGQFRDIPLKELLHRGANSFDDVSVGGLSFSVPLAGNILRMRAYTDNRNEVHADTFDSSIDGDWTNPIGSSVVTMYAQAWASGGIVTAATGGTFRDGGMRTSDDYTDDHYATVTCATQSASNNIIGVLCRAQPTDEYDDCYQWGSVGFGTRNNLRYKVAGSATNMINDNTPSDALAANETHTLEAEGTTIRAGYDRGAGDTQHSTDQTDSTWSSGGYPCLYLYDGTGTPSNASITAVSMGSIGAVGGSIAPLAHHHFHMNLR